MMMYQIHGVDVDLNARSADGGRSRVRLLTDGIS